MSLQSVPWTLGSYQIFSIFNVSGARYCLFFYQKGACVRLDTTLVGFENNAWTRGSRSLLFVENNGEMAFHEVDHDAKVVRTEKAAAKSKREPSDIHSSIPSDATLQQRMRTPVMLTTIDAENIKFERSRSGFLWRADKVEQIGGHECKVFHASNVTFVTRIRSEHLTENDKVKCTMPPSFLITFRKPDILLGMGRLNRNRCRAK